MNLVLLGAPGVGKGTQAEKMSEEYAIAHISTGDILREAVDQGTDLGIKARTYMSEGKLVPDELVISIVEERLRQDDCQDGFILDGFPRTVAQAEVLGNVLGNMGKKLDMVLDIEVDQQELVRRLTKRRQCGKCGKIYHLEYNPPADEGICDECGGAIYQRADDKEEAIKKRLEEYRSKTHPLIAYYEKLDLLKVVDGQQAAADVFADIRKVIEGALA
jgi:adenylate kinase